MKTGKIKCENQLVFIISNLSTDSGLTCINFNSRRSDNFSRLSEGAEESLDEKRQKTATFSEEKLATFHYDLPDHVKALLVYRQDYATRKLADRKRQEIPWLDPILQEAHRMKILEKYGRIELAVERLY